jgi:hypothetical protein
MKPWQMESLYVRARLLGKQWNEQDQRQEGPQGERSIKSTGKGILKGLLLTGSS